LPFSLHPSVKKINHDKKDVRGNWKPHLVGENASPAVDILENAKDQPDSSFLLKEKIMENNRPKPRNPKRILARRPEAGEVFRKKPYSFSNRDSYSRTNWSK